jgi:maltooligosyltrehalose trehalohydrolase
MEVKVGAWAHDGGVEFRVWAPDHDRVDVMVAAPTPARHPLSREDGDYHHAFVAGLAPGTRYRYALGDDSFADPASRWQPDDVHGDSAVLDPVFDWSSPSWRGRALDEYVISEVHIGTFTDEGTFDAAVSRLDDLVRLGVTAIELMPVAEFPGGRNWGYDGVFPYAAESSYGGPDALRRLVDTAHARGLAVVLDVVYNHLGPEGAVLSRFGPYFTDRYRTPWGEALNFDGDGADAVRNYCVQNACEWVRDFRIDALRLDAIHAIVDPTAYPFVEELVDAVHEVARVEGRHIWVIAESSANDARLITPKERGGIGADAQWSDDFHHALHVLLTGEREEYYADFDGVADLAKAYEEGFVYTGEYSRVRGRRHGRSAAGLPGDRFVVFAQNHDHIGNRAVGDRLSESLDVVSLKVAAAAVLASPFVPLLFMGEEYGETSPFPYFVSHTDPGLVDAVRKGRREEFAEFARDVEVPDPQAVATFASAKLHWRPEGEVWEWHRDLLAVRRELAALRHLDPAATSVQVFDEECALVVTRHGEPDVAVVLSFATSPRSIEATLPAGVWDVLLSTHPAAAIESNGTAALSFPGRSALLLSRTSP